MTSRRTVLLAATSLLPWLGTSAVSTATEADAAAEVRAAEIAFAATMARRDLNAFGSFISDDAVFMNGGRPLRGKQAIVEHWTRFFAEPHAPFSWQPEFIEVTSGGTLGYSEGPVRLASGEQKSRYHATWQRKTDGKWRVAFDAGCGICP